MPWLLLMSVPTITFAGMRSNTSKLIDRRGLLVRWWELIFLLSTHSSLADDRKLTIATMWAGSPVVKEHYAAHKGKRRLRSPGLPTPNPVPAAPYTDADVVQAKGYGTMPIPPPPPPPPVQAPIVPPTQTVATQTQAAPPPQSQPAAAQTTTSVNKLPYDFWPHLPWSAEPPLPELNLGKVKKKEYKYPWLDTDTHMLSGADEGGWHGAKLLGVGGFGVAGLWVQSNETNNVVDVRSMHPWREITLRFER